MKVEVHQISKSSSLKHLRDFMCLIVI